LGRGENQGRPPLENSVLLGIIKAISHFLVDIRFIRYHSFYSVLKQ
jgi:hypothetical protein